MLLVKNLAQEIFVVFRLIECKTTEYFQEFHETQFVLKSLQRELIQQARLQLVDYQILLF